MQSEKGFDLNTILLEVFDYWYFKVFEAFNDKWKVQKPGIMEFNQFLDRVYTNDFLTNHHRHLQDYIDKLRIASP